jgi:thioredoxin-like negative regulator of GroEL
MIELTGDTFEVWQREVLDASQEGLVIAYFTSPTCGPCRLLKPNLERLEQEWDLTVVRIDATINLSLVRDFRIMSVPTLYFYSGGFQVATHTGMMQKKELVEVIEKYQ